MKFVTILLASAFLTSAAMANDPFGASTGTTIAPSVTVPASTACAVGSQNQGSEEQAICQAVMTSGVSTLVTSAIILLKEEIQQVEGDAYNFLAGEEMTLALANVVERLQAEAPELQEKSAEEVVALMLESISL